MLIDVEADMRLTCRLTNVRDFPVPKGHVSAKIEVCVHFQPTIKNGEVL
jgi:hypothetical protein